MKHGSASHTRAMFRGIALIETVVLMTATAVLSGIIVTGLAAVLRYNQSIHGHFVRQTALQQMATTLRGDIHQATSVRWNADSQTLLLQLPEQQVLEYQKWKNRWVRVLTLGSAKQATTSFGVDDSFRCDCQAERVHQGALIHLTLINVPLSQPREHAQTERTLQAEISAVVGRDHSLLVN